MSRRWATAAAVMVLAAAGLATATPTPVPDADPIGSVIPQPPLTQPPPEADPPPEEEPPPAPGETPVVVVPPASSPPASAPLIVEVEPLEVEEVEEIEEEADEARAEATLPDPVEAEPLPRVRRQVAILQALDKVTAETIRFEAPVGQQRRWRGLVFRVRACEVTAEDERMRDHIAYLEITSQPRTREGRASSREVFQGWSFASAPGLNPFEHPLYDVWVIACQAAEPETPAGS